MPRASLTLAPSGHWQGPHSTQRGHPLPGNPCLRGVWTWGHPGESRDLLGPSQLHRPPTCKQGVWWPAWPGNRPAAEGMVQRSLAGPVPVCPPVPGPAPAPPPPFLFHLAGSGAGAASLHAGGHRLLLRQGWVSAGRARLRGGRSRRPASVYGGAGGKLRMQPKSRVREGAQPRGREGVGRGSNRENQKSIPRKENERKRRNRRERGASVEGIKKPKLKVRAVGLGKERGWNKTKGAQMIPRHVRIKKLPAKHKQSQVSEGGGAGRRDSGQRGGRAAAARGGAAGEQPSAATGPL